MKNNGKQLEKTIRLIQETYKDSPNTEIFSNHKIENESGRKREFDIVIVSKVNDFEIRIVIECKDYSKKVAVREIEAFNSKCERIRGINKKVFVSSMGYQADAIECANRFNIELLIANEITSEIIKEKVSINNIKFKIFPKFEIYSIHFNNTIDKYFEDIHSNYMNIIYYQNNKEENLTNLLMKVINENQQNVDEASICEWLKLSKKGKFEDRFMLPFIINFKDVIIKSKAEKIANVLEVKGSVCIQLILIEPALIYKGTNLQNINGDEKANTISIDIGNGKIGDFTIGNNNNVTFFLTNKHGKTKQLEVFRPLNILNNP